MNPQKYAQDLNLDQNCEILPNLVTLAPEEWLWHRVVASYCRDLGLLRTAKRSDSDNISFLVVLWRQSKFR